LSPILFSLCTEYLINGALEELGDFKIGQVIRTVKYTNDFVLLAKEEAVLHGMIDRLAEAGRCCGMEINVEKSKVMRISRQPSLVQIMINEEQMEKVEYFKHLCSLMTDDARCDIKSRNVIKKAAFNKKKTLFTRKLD
jgi:hypothetical protein